MEQSDSHPDRRPIRARGASVFARAAEALARLGVTPNAISVSSMVFAAGAFFALYLADRDTMAVSDRVLLFAAAVCIQGRLIANLLDGIVAVEGGKRSPVGELFNEVPDRVSDGLILVGVGVWLSGGGVVLAWAATAVAIATAYVRVQGKAAGAAQHYVGPMAKPHRMALLTVLLVYAAFVPASWQSLVVDGQAWHVLMAGLWVIVIGCLLTCLRRLRLIAMDLRGGQH